MSSFSVTSGLDGIDLDIVHRWLSTDAFWAIGRSRETVETAAQASLNFGAFDSKGRLVGYARVVTDYATFAWLCDVYVSREARGNGLGQMLAQSVIDKLRPMALKRVMLSTLDAHGLYEKVGFVPLPNPEELMSLNSSSR